MFGIVKKARKPGCVDLVSDLPKPDVGPEEVLIEVKAASICGSDIHAFNYDKGYEFLKIPVILGHEIAGKVVETGSSVTNLKIGDRVIVEAMRYCGKCKQCKTGKTNICKNFKVIGITTDGGFCEYITANEQYLHIIPDQVSFKEGALVEPGSVAFHALSRCGIFPGAKVVVFGPGVIGFLSALIAKEMGAGEVVLAGRSNARLPLAEKLGLKTLNTAENDLKPFEENFDFLIECSGNSKVLEEHWTLLDKGGKAILVGLYNNTSSIFFSPLVRKEISIMTSYTSSWFDYETVINLLSTGRLNLKGLYHVYNFCDFQNAFRDLMERKVLKPVMVPPWSL